MPTTIQHELEKLSDTGGETETLGTGVYPAGITRTAFRGHLFGLRTKLAQEWPYPHPTLGQTTIPGYMVKAPDLMANLSSKDSFLLSDSSSQDVCVGKGVYGTLQ